LPFSAARVAFNLVGTVPLFFRFSSLLIRHFRPRGVWRLFVQRLPISHATSHELGPFRHYRDWIGPLRQ
jgi:hypothetical protein